MDLGVWACPVCLSDLSESWEGMVCRSEGRFFRQLDGLTLLVRPEQESALGEGQDFAIAWKRTEWAVPRELVSLLPHVRGPVWKQKARSLRKLIEVLGPARNRKVVDIGAGTGWLSYNLAAAGFQCFATDISSGPDVGLGAARAFDRSPYGFERAIATMDIWPFKSNSVDVAICNASLHYMSDTRLAVAEALRVLRHDGTFLVMNEPVHRDASSAIRASQEFKLRMRSLGARGPLVDYQTHFVEADLEKTLRGSFAIVVRHEPDYGFGFRSWRTIKGMALRMELASFPIYEAHGSPEL